jgi:hypothetical protein
MDRHDGVQSFVSCNIFMISMLYRVTNQWHLICFTAVPEILCVKEVKTGLLMLLVCVAIYVQIDSRIWAGLCQLIGRLIAVR